MLFLTDVWLEEFEVELQFTFTLRSPLLFSLILTDPAGTISVLPFLVTVQEPLFSELVELLILTDLLPTDSVATFTSGDEFSEILVEETFLSLFALNIGGLVKLRTPIKIAKINKGLNFRREFLSKDFIGKSIITQLIEIVKEQAICSTMV